MTNNSASQLLLPQHRIFGPGRYLGWNQYETLKGLLIFLIVLGHNSLLTALYPKLAWVLYNFHVSAFLMIPFLFGPDAFTWSNMRDKVTRYMVPFVIFILLMSPVRWFVETSGYIDGALHAQYTLKALLYGTVPLVKTVTGFRLIWFLPALAMLTVLRAWYYVLPLALQRALLVFMLFSTVIINLMQVKIHYMPFGFPIALYMFPLGLLGAHLALGCARVSRQGLLLVALLAVFALLQLVSVQGDLRFDIASLDFPPLDSKPWLFVAQACLVVTGFLVSLVAARYLDALKVFRVIGQYSLLVYLAHSPIFQALLIGAEALGIALTNLFAALTSLLLTLLLAVGFSMFISRFERLRNLITPRDYASLKSVFIRRRA